MTAKMQYMKSKLEEHYEDEIIINSLHRQETTVTFTRSASPIIADFYKTLQLQNLSLKTLSCQRIVCYKIHILLLSMSLENSLSVVPESLKTF